MRRRFRRQMDMPSFKDPVALRRENMARAGLHPTSTDMRRREQLADWPLTPHVTLPATPATVSDASRTAAVLADIVFAARRARSYDEALAAAILIARERRMRRAFGPPYEEYEDDPILR